MLAEPIYARGAAWVPTLHPPRTSVVIDPRLALCPFGTWIVARLSSHLAVWTAPELRELLRGGSAYKDDADRLFPRVHGAKLRGLDLPREAAAIRESLGQWSTFHSSSGGAMRTYYLGDSPSESLLPSYIDSGIFERFEALAQALDAAMTASQYDLPRGSIIAACFRDTAALAGALVHTPTFILSALEADERGAPAICNYLEAWQLTVTDVTARSGPDAAVLRNVLAAAGLGPVEWAGVALTAVHVIPRGTEPAHIYWHRL